MRRAYYQDSLKVFCNQTHTEILGEIVSCNEFALEKKQRDTWIKEIVLLQTALADLNGGGIAFEFTIPRIGARVDNILIYGGIIYVIEFKVGESIYPKHAIEQVLDYALDLKYFHQASQQRQIVPILVCTNAADITNELKKDDDDIYRPIRANTSTLHAIITQLTKQLSDTPINLDDWIASPYMPTPTIIEAAQALYRGHDVREISRSDSEAYNLSLTTQTINQIINESKANNKKSICFITGVPGAGKTLAGLNIANSRHNFTEDEHAVFLSGNGPLVFVLREALARDEYERTDHLVRKKDSYKKASAFIQNIHHFRDDALKTDAAPIEKVVIFDEAQRAWTQEQTAKFMLGKGQYDWNMSEPEFLVSVMDRHMDWAVIVCLIGGGQEINTGEAGLPAWFDALRCRFPSWSVFTSNKIVDFEYTRGIPLDELFSGLDIKVLERLHLAVSLRSFRNERVSEFIKALLDIDRDKAQELILSLRQNYPIMLTRELSTAKQWVRRRARGSERYGLIASSGAKRLRKFGIWVQSEIKAEEWFLNPSDDIRSSYFLEDTATEFDVQGLEIDWAIVAWDADYRFNESQFHYFNFVGTHWNIVKKRVDQLYLKNAYRVLLTRARQGFVIYIPYGEDDDPTRKHEYYDGTYQYLKSIGILEITL